MRAFAVRWAALAVFGTLAAPALAQGVVLAAAFVRFTEPLAASPDSRPVYNVEIYPIADVQDGRWTEAVAVDNGFPARSEVVQPGDRFTIYRKGLDVGWVDVNRVEPQPYAGRTVSVGLGGWSLPRSLYPLRLVQSTGRHYLANAVYSWQGGSAVHSVQPFLALSEQRAPHATPELLPSSQRAIKEMLRAQAALAVNPPRTQRPIVPLLENFRLFDLDRDRVPEAVGVFAVPQIGNQPAHKLILIGNVWAGTYRPLFTERFTAAQWEPLDALDVDGRGWQELVLVGRGFESVTFAVLQEQNGRLRKVFEGASFGR